MEVATYIDALSREGNLLAVAASAAGPDAPVPTCPDWVVRDLLRHLGGVHRWATGIVGTPRTEWWNVEMDDLVGTWPSDLTLVPWFQEGHAALSDTLAAADPALQCWTFLSAPTPLVMWSRRQAHETTIHRIDAEMAAGSEMSPIDARFASDGVDELLSCFITRPGGRLRSDAPSRLAVSSTDASGAWLLEIGPDGVVTTPTTGDADCHVTGPVSDLYGALWNRPGRDGLRSEGDEGLLDLFLDRVHVRWS